MIDTNSIKKIPPIPIAIIVDGWACCPDCWNKLCKVGENAKADNVFAWCKKCHKDIKLKIT